MCVERAVEERDGGAVEGAVDEGGVVEVAAGGEVGEDEGEDVERDQLWSEGHDPCTGASDF